MTRRLRMCALLEDRLAFADSASPPADVQVPAVGRLPDPAVTASAPIDLDTHRAGRAGLAAALCWGDPDRCGR
jgi:hypothetical protein